MRHVFEKKQLCTGCGVCAGLCKSIKMTETEIGHYIPDLDEEKCVGCQKCSGICPVLQHTEITSQINKECFGGSNYKCETGYYLSCYEGRSKEHLKTSASGGLCTAFLEVLLDKGLVDGIYCVGSSSKKDTFYEYQLVTDSKKLRKNSLSAYYPVNLEKVIGQILNYDRRVAIVVLPCQAKALRLAMKKNNVLNRRIKYLIGLVCGGLPGKAMVHYISESIGVKEVERITFREKSENKKCNNCAVTFYNGDEINKSHFHGEPFGFAYFNKFFHNEACNICEDIFAESADLAFGDAWYNEYREQIWGTSICLIRNEELKELFDNVLCKIKGVTVKKIDADRLVLSQKNVGVIGMKKKGAPIFSRIYSLLGFKNAKVREIIKISQIEKVKIYIVSLRKLIMQCYARKLWGKYKNGNLSFYEIDKKLRMISKLFKKR